MKRIAGVWPEIVAVLVVLAALAARSIWLGDPQLYRDEAASWYLASLPLDKLLAQSAHETFPPLYLVLLKVWMGIFGDSEAALRSLSVAFWLGLVAATFGFARAAVGRRAGLVAAVVVALSPALLANSISARMYTLEALLAALAWWLLWRLLAAGGSWPRRRQATVLVGIGILAAGEVWTMSLGIPLLGLQGLFALAGAVRLRQARAWWAAVALALGGLSLLPWVPNLLSVAGNGQPFWTPRPDLGSLATTVGGWFLAGPHLWLVFVPVLAVGLAVAGLWSLIVRPAASGGARSEPDDARLLALALVLGLGLVPAVWLYSQVRSVYDPRYLGIGLPEVAILLAAGVGWLGSAAGVRMAGRRAAGAVVPLTVIVLTLAMALESGLAIDRFRTEQAVDPARQVVAALGREVRPGDVVMTLNAQSYFPLDYYLVRSGEADRLGVQLYHWHRPTAAFFTGWEDIDPARVIDQPRIDAVGWDRALGLGPGSRIWLVTSTDPDYEFARFAPAQTGALRIVGGTVLTGSGGPAEIWEAVPAGR